MWRLLPNSHLRPEYIFWSWKRNFVSVSLILYSVFISLLSLFWRKQEEACEITILSVCLCKALSRYGKSPPVTFTRTCHRTISWYSCIQCRLSYLVCSLLSLLWNVCSWDHLAICLFMCPSNNFWMPEPNFYETCYVGQGTWAHINGVLHKSLPSVIPTLQPP
jgi:hypothetical protein